MRGDSTFKKVAEVTKQAGGDDLPLFFAFAVTSATSCHGAFWGKGGSRETSGGAAFGYSVTLSPSFYY